MIRPSVPILLLSLLLPAAFASAADPGPGVPTHGIPTHGIAMHGDLALPPGFAAFPYVNPSAPKGGTMRQAVVGTFDSLNPHIVKGVPALGLGYVFETLLTRSWDEPFSLYGLLADRVEVAADRSAVTFHINEKARWHDGTPVTAEDVLFSLEVQRRHGTPNRRLFYAKVATAEAPDPRTVRFAFATSDGGPDGGPDGGIDREMPLLMGLMPIHSKAFWTGREFDHTTLEPVMGSGPYRIGAVDPGRRILYERVPDYWGRDLPTRVGQFNADRLEFDYYRDDSVALEAFKAGQGDVRYESDPAKWAVGYDGPALNGGRIVLEELPNRRPEPARGLIFNTRRPLFADVRVRQALGMATDFDWIGRNLFRGLLTRTASYYPNSELAARGLPDGEELAALEPFRDRLPRALFTRPPPLPGATSGADTGGGPAGLRANRREAMRLLAEAGWRVRDGRLADAAGARFAFEILLSDPAEERVALEFARSLEPLGIDARVRTVDSAQFQARLEGFDFDMTLRWWASSLSPGNEQLYYYGTAAAGDRGSRNLAGIRDPVVDALARSIAAAGTRAELVGRVRALDRVLLWGHYMVPLFHSPVDRIARWTRLHRPAVTPLYGPLTETWWVE
ncbi:extracellular solute-binding protein [Azospirillum picis]|uniref:Microcin C transport system substrate-binding protein n=1 Tax=Azospirillum picis TaxID=488438 RepID=A0ABU0MKT9_9PROT|nr:extracellular solute-binding protein [Azospirillum picis]MBP2299894.1 microcin C transport system substrate-binding protein [Azospirillum picis]MDQ0533868.1 microcin C transport system substrate-binding protein [Azospirillum picis]